MAGWTGRLGSIVGRAALSGAKAAVREVARRQGLTGSTRTRGAGGPVVGTGPARSPGGGARSGRRTAPGPGPERRAPVPAPVYRGEATTVVDPVYDPRPDGRPDPGEVVWAWVPYEDDPAQGKDRPVLVLARDGEDLLGLMLTSTDRGSGRHTTGDGRQYLDVGTGGWDSQHRPSEVRLDRVLRLDPDTVRREGAALDRARFDQVVAAARRANGW